MDSLLVQGGTKLKGNIEISGAKNAALPIMAASILTGEKLILGNMPTTLTDIDTMNQLLSNLGVDCDLGNKSVTLKANNITNLEAPYDIVRKMRASIWVLGPLLTRFGKAKVSFPGGCALGARQVDLHIDGLKAMGAKIEIEQGYIHAKAQSGLSGTEFKFSKVSVGATINLIMAATLAKGDSILSNCAKEPEIVDLCNCLNEMGAKISGIGTQELKITGVTSLTGNNYSIISDRIEAGTYMMAGAMSAGELSLTNIDEPIVENTIIQLKKNGIDIEAKEDRIIVKSDGKYEAIDMSTTPYPGFATDLQAQYMTLMCQAQGNCTITENLFENRFMHVPELCRLGANIKVNGYSASVSGNSRLVGTEVMASDLRASVSLVMAGLVAEGQTKISRIYHLDRGYESLEDKLRACGAEIERLKGDDV